MNIDILIIGGTRLLGKKIVENFITAGTFNLYVLSRKSAIYKEKCFTIEAERSEGISKLVNKEFDVVIDFIAYGEKDVKEIINHIKFKKYIFISSCWMTKLNKKYKADEFIEQVDKAVISLLPTVTHNYLINKLAAENYLMTKLPKGSFHILRLPIFWGEDDHTKRLTFYVSRFLDNQPILMINNGNNICQIAYVDDLSKNIFNLFQSNKLIDQLILEALPDSGKKVMEILQTIGKGIGSKSELTGVKEEVLKRELPEYLEVEPLWRENKIEISKNNIYSLLNSKSEPIELWLKKLAIQEAGKKPPVDPLRSCELQLVTAIR